MTVKMNVSDAGYVGSACKLNDDLRADQTDGQISEETQKISQMAQNVIRSLPEAPKIEPISSNVRSIDQVIDGAIDHLNNDVKPRIQNGSPEELLQMANDVPSIEEALNVGAQKAALPNLAAAILDLGLKKEAQLSEKMAGHKQKIDEHKETMRSVIDLKTDLQKLSEDEEKVALTDTIRQKISALREKGIDLLPGSNLDQLSALELRSLKSRCKDTQDELQNAIQTILTTEVNVVIQFLNMLADVMKKTTDLQDRACRKAISPHG